MKNVKTLALAATAVAATFAAPTFAADRGDDIHAGDYSWMQFNYMYALEELPRSPDAPSGHDYLEMEFGGRSGIFDLYGYVDVFNPSERDSSDKTGKAKMFMKFAPRISLDALTGMDLSVGPIKEVYISTLFNWGGGYDQNPAFGYVNNSFWGVGADVEVPWLGKTGMNLYGLYDLNAKEWNGYQFSANWFKPFINFDNGSFISFQGYVDYQFGADNEYRGNSQATSGGAAFFGLYWHSEQFALGYGLKAYNDIYLIKDSDAFESSGVSHYFSATYKF
ncbi:nucleoside-specific channel-forming Tsx family protein [Shewanella sp. 125m-1]